MTDKKTPLTTEPTKSTGTQSSVSQSAKAKATNKTAATNKTTAKKVATKETAGINKAKVSKLALVALVIAIGSTAVHYFWQQQQSQLLTIKLSQQIDHKNTTTINQFQAQLQTQLKQALKEQQQIFTKQLQQLTAQVNGSNQTKMSELNTAVSQLERSIKQRQPSDWLLHEAEYLIRIAARTLWLEHDATAVIALLKEADARLADLKNPRFLSVRELVHLDIKALELMPTLETDEIVLTLMTMNRQVAMLPLALVDIETKTDNDISNEVSNDINDWQANLSKTWEKFLDDFISVRQRTGMVKPLVSPEQQQNLKQNLTLKIQLALWAATQRKSELYQETLTDIQQWVTEFFDLKEAINQQFLQALTDLQAQRVSFDYSRELTSLTAIRIALKKPSTRSVTLPTKIADDVERKLAEKQADEVPDKALDKEEVEPEKSSILPKKQDEQPNVEGIK